MEDLTQNPKTPNLRGPLCALLGGFHAEVGIEFASLLGQCP